MLCDLVSTARFEAAIVEGEEGTDSESIAEFESVLKLLLSVYMPRGFHNGGAPGDVFRSFSPLGSSSRLHGQRLVRLISLTFRPRDNLAVSSVSRHVPLTRDNSRCVNFLPS